MDPARTGRSVRDERPVNVCTPRAPPVCTGVIRGYTASAVSVGPGEPCCGWPREHRFATMARADGELWPEAAAHGSRRCGPRPSYRDRPNGVYRRAAATRRSCGALHGGKDWATRGSECQARSNRWAVQPNAGTVIHRCALGATVRPGDARAAPRPYRAGRFRGDGAFTSEPRGAAPTGGAGRRHPPGVSLWIVPSSTAA